MGSYRARVTKAGSDYRVQKPCLGSSLNHVAVTRSLLTSIGTDDLAGHCSGRNTTVHRLSTRRPS